MIGKAWSNSSLTATLHYNQKADSVLFYKNRLAGDDISDFRMQMEDLHKCYTGRSEKLIIHAVLSPAPEEGINLSNADWTNIANSYLQKLGLLDHQAIGFIHSDKEHKHLHLVINKVNEKNLKLYSDSFIGKKTHKMADQIASEMNLVSAREIMFQRRLQTINEKDLGIILQPQMPAGNGIKLKMKLLLDDVIQTKYADAETFFKALEKRNLVIHRYKNSQTKELRGYGIELGGCILDASAIGRKYSLRALGLQSASTTNTNTKTNCKTNTGKLVSLKNNKGKKILEELASNYGIRKESLRDERIIMLQRDNYYYLAIQNDSKGYTLYNTYSKTYEGEKDITTVFIDEKYQTIIVQDLFGYLRWKHEHRNEKFNFLIINTPTNKEKLSETLTKLPLHKITIAMISQPGSELINKIIWDYIKQIFLGELHAYKRQSGFSTIEFSKKPSSTKNLLETEDEQKPEIRQANRIK